MRMIFVRVGALAAIAGAILQTVIAQDASTAFRRPSVAPQTPEVQQATPIDQFQFNGYMIMGDEVRVSIFNQNTGKGEWLRAGKNSESGIGFTRFDADNESVVLSQNGISKRVTLKKSKVTSIKSAPRTASAVPNTVPTANNNARPANPNIESDEAAQERIRKVAEEIRRRRAERRARLQQQQSGNRP